MHFFVAPTSTCLRGESVEGVLLPQGQEDFGDCSESEGTLLLAGPGIWGCPLRGNLGWDGSPASSRHCMESSVGRGRFSEGTRV